MSTFRWKPWTSEVVQCMKAPVTKPDDLSSILGTHVVEGITYTCKFFSTSTCMWSSPLLWILWIKRCNNEVGEATLNTEPQMQAADTGGFSVTQAPNGFCHQECAFLKWWAILGTAPNQTEKSFLSSSIVAGFLDPVFTQKCQIVGSDNEQVSPSIWKLRWAPRSHVRWCSVLFSCRTTSISILFLPNARGTL